MPTGQTLFTILAKLKPTVCKLDYFDGSSWDLDGLVDDVRIVLLEQLVALNSSIRRDDYVYRGCWDIDRLVKDMVNMMKAEMIEEAICIDADANKQSVMIERAHKKERRLLRELTPLLSLSRVCRARVGGTASCSR